MRWDKTRDKVKVNCNSHTLQRLEGMSHMVSLAFASGSAYPETTSTALGKPP